MKAVYSSSLHGSFVHELILMWLGWEAKATCLGERPSLEMQLLKIPIPFARELVAVAGKFA